MRSEWSKLDEELRRWRAEKLDLSFWWRDDDAITQTAALDQLAGLAGTLSMPVHLAIIPKFADQRLVELCKSQSHLVPLVHGWAHENHAPDGEKKAEFGHQRAALRQDADMALNQMRMMFGADLAPVFVPPWNRIEPTLLPDLAAIGYATLSTYTPRITQFAAPGLLQINTHIDPINWRGGGGLLAVEKLVGGLVKLLQDRRAGRTDRSEPLGLLTHHLVHDADIWRFTESCIARLLDGGARPVNLSIKEVPRPRA